MEPVWSERFWEMFVDADYALIPIKKVRLMVWPKYASLRFWSTSGKWYGY